MTNEQMTNDKKAAQHFECHSQSWGNNDIKIRTAVLLALLLVLMPLARVGVRLAIQDHGLQQQSICQSARKRAGCLRVTRLISVLYSRLDRKAVPDTRMIVAPEVRFSA